MILLVGLGSAEFYLVADCWGMFGNFCWPDFCPICWGPPRNRVQYHFDGEVLCIVLSGHKTQEKSHVWVFPLVLLRR